MVKFYSVWHGKSVNVPHEDITWVKRKNGRYQLLGWTQYDGDWGEAIAPVYKFVSEETAKDYPKQQRPKPGILMAMHNWWNGKEDWNY